MSSFSYMSYNSIKRGVFFFKERHVCLALNCLAFMKSDIELGMALDTLGSSPAAGPWRSHISTSESKNKLNHKMAMRIKWKIDVKVFNSVPITCKILNKFSYF